MANSEITLIWHCWWEYYFNTTRVPDMPFEKVQNEKISNSVVLQIEQLILRGILRPGERLPPERELADRLSVSRPSLRKAFAELQQKGLLDARAGSGVFVADVLGSAFSPALIELFATHEEAVFDYLDFRRDLEGMAAERAARFASDADLMVINTIFSRMANADRQQDSQKEAELDARFHSAIVEASHNVVLLHMMRSMIDLLRSGVFYNRQVIFSQTNIRQALLDQHRAINKAIQNRNPDAAKAAIHTHLDFIAQTLRDQRRTERNAKIATQRLKHETGLG